MSRTSLQKKKTTLSKNGQCLNIDFTDLRNKTITRGQFIDWFLSNDEWSRLKITSGSLIDMAINSGVNVLRFY